MRLMPASTSRELSTPAYAALKTEVLRAGVELSDEQLMDLADALHSLMRLRRPSRPIGRAEAWLEAESPWFS
jgi:hypothetical protein